MAVVLAATNMTTMMSSSYLAITRRNIDNQLLEISETHRRLREQRNNLSYICRLPREILCLIFHIYMEDARKTTSGNPTARWFTFTHVCTAWRTAAVYNPALWTHISFHQPLWTLEMLRRSRNLPISVHLSQSVYKQASFDIVDTTLQQSSRISHLHLATAKYAIMSHLMSKLTGPFNAMRSLEISITFQDIPMITAPDIFSDSNFPVLNTLILSGCGFNWEGMLPSSLTSLSVSYDSGLSQTTHPHMNHVINILRSTPHLSKLTLMWSLFIKDDIEYFTERQEPSSPLELTQLTYLRIADKAPALTSFLSKIRIPHNTHVHVGCQATSMSSIEKFGSAASQCDMISNSRAITFVSVDQISTEHVHFVMKCFIDDPTELRIDLTWMHWGDLSGEDALLALGHFFDLTELTTICLIDIGPIGHAIWSTALSSAIRLSTIRVCGSPSDGLFRALYEDLSDSVSPTFLPGLRNISLEKIRFQVEETKESFFQFLDSRHSSGFGLQRITIHDSSGFEPEDHYALQRIVPDAYWDEIVLVDTNSSDGGMEHGIQGESDGYGSEYWSLDEYDYQD